MSFKLVSSGGDVNNPTVVNLTGSGTIKQGEPVDFVRGADYTVAPTTSSSTTTMVFGIGASYIQGESDSEVLVIPFTSNQLWEATCANAAITAQCGIRHALSASDRGVIHNTSTDVSTQTGIFTALSMVGSTSGSGKLIGYFNRNHQLIPVNSTTFLQ